MEARKGRPNLRAPRVYRPFRAGPSLVGIQGQRARFASHSPLATFCPRLRRLLLPLLLLSAPSALVTTAAASVRAFGACYYRCCFCPRLGACYYRCCLCPRLRRLLL